MKILEIFIEGLLPGIGPHQDRELELMLAGKKPAAMIDKSTYMDQFKPYVDRGRFVADKIDVIRKINKFGVREQDRFQWVVTQPSEYKRIQKIQRIYDDVNRIGEMTETHHARLGMLLGYSKEHIRAFLNQDYFS